MYSILKNANKEQMFCLHVWPLLPGGKGDSVGGGSSCLGSGGDSGADGYFPGLGEKARGAVRKLVVVSLSRVLLSLSCPADWR